ncbi:MAG: GH116 family glycosyl-hydrolase [Anaerolineales bacterium]|jgi:uncharacterized protein (DUF608 family)
MKETHPDHPSLFPTNLSERTWLQFDATGFDQPVSGMIFRASHPTCCGVALGGLGTGCLDIEATGVLGFNTLFPAPQRELILCAYRNPQMLLPFLGLAVGGKTWVLATEEFIQGGTFQGCTEPIYKEPEKIAMWRTEVPKIEGVESVKDIQYWGHYPVADLEYETSASFSVGLRAWAPFIPGDLGSSSIPAAIFEVHLHNPSDANLSGTLAFNFPGLVNTDPRHNEFLRTEVTESFRGVTVTTPNVKMGYVLAAMDANGANEVIQAVRVGGDLANDPGAWSQIAKQLPAPLGETKDDQILYNDPSASLAVDFKIQAGGTAVIRFLLTWYAPAWKGGGYTDILGFERHWGYGPYEPPGRENEDGVDYLAMYATRYDSALDVAQQMARDHIPLLRRVLAWQEAIYTAEELPVWLRDCLVNNLNLITEDSYWAQPREPLGRWSFPEGAFNLVESPRGCAIMGCIVSNWYGDFPILYFFPELEKMLLRDYREYLRPDGAVPFLWPNGDFTKPTYEWLLPLNGPCYVDLVGRLWLRTGDDNILREFYPSVKRNTEFTMTLKPPPEGIISVHREGVGQEWWEHTPVYGMVTHVGGMRLSNLCIVKRMAEALGDQDFADQCQEWIEGGSRLLEENLWAGDSYLFYFDPQAEEAEFEYLEDVTRRVGVPQKRSDDIMSSQLDGEWANYFHGLGGVFRQERVKKVLETIQKTCLVDCGVVGFATREGDPDLIGYGTFPPEINLVGMTYMYHGQKELGLEIVRRNMDNLVRVQGHAWDLPNLVRADTGARTFGTDYFQNMMLWAVPAALSGEDLSAPCKPGGLVDRVLRAGAG